MKHGAFFPCQQQIPEISNEYIYKNFKGQPPKSHIILISWFDLLGKFMVRGQWTLFVQIIVLTPPQQTPHPLFKRHIVLRWSGTEKQCQLQKTKNPQVINVKWHYSLHYIWDKILNGGNILSWMRQVSPLVCCILTKQNSCHLCWQHLVMYRKKKKILP